MTRHQRLALLTSAALKVKAKRVERAGKCNVVHQVNSSDLLTNYHFGRKIKAPRQMKKNLASQKERLQSEVPLRRDWVRAFVFKLKSLGRVMLKYQEDP
jgi:hypothetical protein